MQELNAFIYFIHICWSYKGLLGTLTSTVQQNLLLSFILSLSEESLKVCMQRMHEADDKW